MSASPLVRKLQIGKQRLASRPKVKVEFNLPSLSNLRFGDIFCKNCGKVMVYLLLATAIGHKMGTAPGAKGCGISNDLVGLSICGRIMTFREYICMA